MDSSRMTSPSLQGTSAPVTAIYSSRSTVHVDTLACATRREGALAAAAPQNCTIGCSRTPRTALQASRGKGLLRCCGCQAEYSKTGQQGCRGTQCAVKRRSGATKTPVPARGHT